MAFSNTFLQALTLGLAFGIAYFFCKIKPVWWMYIIGFIISFFASWFLGVIVWSLIFIPDNYTSAIVYGMPRSFLFSIVGAIIGIVMINKKKKTMASNKTNALGQ